MKKIISVPIFLLLNVFFDSIFFVRLNLWGTRPDTVIAIITAISITSGSLAGTAYGLAAGLLLDVLFGKYIGLLSLIYMLPAMAAGFFYRRYYADNKLFPCLIAMALYIVKELLLIVFLLITQQQYNYFMVLWRYLLPSAILTGLITYPINVLYKKLQQRQLYRERYR